MGSTAAFLGNGKPLGRLAHPGHLQLGMSGMWNGAKKKTLFLKACQRAPALWPQCKGCGRCAPDEIRPVSIAIPTAKKKKDPNLHPQKHPQNNTQMSQTNEPISQRSRNVTKNPFSARLLILQVKLRFICLGRGGVTQPPGHVAAHAGPAQRQSFSVSSRYDTRRYLALGAKQTWPTGVAREGPRSGRRHSVVRHRPGGGRATPLQGT